MAPFGVFESAAQPTAVVRATLTVSELPAFFGRAFSSVAAVLSARGTPPNQAPFAYYPRLPGATIEVEAGFPVAAPIAASGEVVPSQLPAGTIARATHIGSYGQLTETYTALADWAAIQELALSGPMWEVYLSDPQLEPDPSTWRTDIFAYVVPAPVAATAGAR